MLGAILFGLAPDTLRVALAEGNLPRALATAMLPALTYCLLRTMGEDGRRRHAIAGALLLAAIILSHAMMGAIFGAGLGLLAVLLAWLQPGPIRQQASRSRSGGTPGATVAGIPCTTASDRQIRPLTLSALNFP